MNFNPRTPCGVRPVMCSNRVQWLSFQSTHPVWGATRKSQGPEPSNQLISIHAPRVGCDLSPHSLGFSSLTFQSTHPVWGATRKAFTIGQIPEFQSTHPVWGATPGLFLHRLSFPFQSTHPVWGATPFFGHQAGIYGLFQSTHPVWGATVLPGRQPSWH